MSLQKRRKPLPDLEPLTDNEDDMPPLKRHCHRESDNNEDSNDETNESDSNSNEDENEENESDSNTDNEETFIDKKSNKEYEKYLFDKMESSLKKLKKREEKNINKRDKWMNILGWDLMGHVNENKKQQRKRQKQSSKIYEKRLKLLSKLRTKISVFYDLIFFMKTRNVFPTHSKLIILSF